MPTVHLVARALGLDFWVDLSILGQDDHFVAFAHVAGDIELGFGSSAREAIDAVLTREFKWQAWSFEAVDV